LKQIHGAAKSSLLTLCYQVSGVGKIGPVKITNLGANHNIRRSELVACQVVGCYIGGPVAYFLRCIKFFLGKNAPRYIYGYYNIRSFSSCGVYRNQRDNAIITVSRRGPSEKMICSPLIRSVVTVRKGIRVSWISMSGIKKSTMD